MGPCQLEGLEMEPLRHAAAIGPASSTRRGQQRYRCRARRSNFVLVTASRWSRPVTNRRAETGESKGTQLDLECLGAAPSRIWALAGASRRPPHSFRSGLTASIL